MFYQSACLLLVCASKRISLFYFLCFYKARRLLLGVSYHFNEEMYFLEYSRCLVIHRVLEIVLIVDFTTCACASFLQLTFLHPTFVKSFQDRCQVDSSYSCIQDNTTKILLYEVDVMLHCCNIYIRSDNTVNRNHPGSPYQMIHCYSRNTTRIVLLFIFKAVVRCNINTHYAFHTLNSFYPVDNSFLPLFNVDSSY